MKIASLPSVSIVIPCLNEEHYIGKLLGCLAAQSFHDFEVIIVDGKSEDRTSEVVSGFCKKHPHLAIRFVVADKRGVSHQRNLGAREAKFERLLFLDADVQFEAAFLEETLSELKERGLDVATANFEPLSVRLADKLLFAVGNAYIQLVQFWEPVSQGWCIFITTHVHNAIGGFDETLRYSEDYDYILRAAKYGKRLKVLRKGKVYFSVRRLNEEGRFNYFKKTILMEVGRVFSGKIDTHTFDYHFGQFKHDVDAERFDSQWLRKKV